MVIHDNKVHGLSPTWALVKGPARHRASSVTIDGEIYDRGVKPLSTCVRRRMLRSVITMSDIVTLTTDCKTRAGRRKLRSLAYSSAYAIVLRRTGNMDKARAAGYRARESMSKMLAVEATELRQAREYAAENRIGARRDHDDPRDKLFGVTATEFSSRVPFFSSYPLYVRNTRPAVDNVHHPMYVVGACGRCIETGKRCPVEIDLNNRL